MIFYLTFSDDEEYHSCEEEHSQQPFYDANFDEQYDSDGKTNFSY